MKIKKNENSLVDNQILPKLRPRALLLLVPIIGFLVAGCGSKTTEPAVAPNADPKAAAAAASKGAGAAASGVDGRAAAEAAGRDAAAAAAAKTGG